MAKKKTALKKKSKAQAKAAKTKSARPAPRSARKTATKAKPRPAAKKVAKKAKPKAQLKAKPKSPLKSKPKPKKTRAVPKKAGPKKAKKTVKSPIKQTKKPAKAAAPKAAAKARTKTPSNDGAGKSASRTAVMAESRGGAKRTYIPDIDRPTGMYGGVLLSNDPKPFPKKSPYSKDEIAELKKALTNERDRLRRELANMESATMGTPEGELESPGFPTHIAEYAAIMQATETTLSVRSLEEERLEQVEEALRRIEEKRTYGLCLACGEKIGIERLVAKPHAHLCMDCRRLYERSRGLAG